MAHAFVAPPSPRHARFRARRITVDFNKLGPVRASMVHADAGRIEGEVRDLSLHGLAVEPSTPPGPTLFAGDRLSNLEIDCGERQLFRGTGIVRRISDAPNQFTIGIELTSGGIDLAELLREETRQGFTQRLRGFEGELSRLAHVGPTFKAWVADLRTELEALKKFLTTEEQAYANEDLQTRTESEREILDMIQPRILQRMLLAREQLNELVRGFSEEEHELHRAYLKKHVVPLFTEAPFARRAFEKPYGYAGDYEMMNMLYRDHREGDSLFARAMNDYATKEDAAVANINRIEFIQGLITSRLNAKPDGTFRIASIGCGPAFEIHSLLRSNPEIGSRLDVALLDQDERSITHCERVLAPLAKATGARIHFIRESVRSLLTARDGAQLLGERDLIYSAGLFDYLGDRAFRLLLMRLYDALAAGGAMAIGNVASHNSSRWVMEYVLEWFLIHRSASDLESMCSDLDPRPRSVSVTSEPSGINLFLLVER